MSEGPTRRRTGCGVLAAGLVGGVLGGALVFAAGWFLVCQGLIADIESSGRLWQPRPMADVRIEGGDSAVIKEAIARVDPAVVYVSALEAQETVFGPVLEGRGTGTGFVFDAEQGFILTNHHVVEDDPHPIVRMLQPDGSDVELQAYALAAAPALDIAVLKVEAENLPAVEFGDPGDLAPGDWLIAIGCPFGLGHTSTVGVVSALDRRFVVGDRSYDSMIQTDAAINPGNSGGPLVNVAGQVVGMNSVIQSPTQTSVGVGFAISAAKLRQVVSSLLSDTYLGIQVAQVSAWDADQWGPGPDSRCLVTSVVPGGPAERAGVLENDWVVEINGENVGALDDVSRLLGGVRPGEQVRLLVYRATTGGRGERVSLSVTAERRGEMRPADPSEAESA